MSETIRQPHAYLNLPSRRLKALKIEQLLGLENRKQPIQLLEVGTGSGGIAHYFGTHALLRCDVDAVDVHDSRAVKDGYRFQQVNGVQLPFSDESFDVVLSNHVIEHVGNEQAQRLHLAELRRVLKPDGMGYLAVPNRWMLVEPHYRLVCLSWLPHSWRTPYLHFARKGQAYDCEPLELRRIEKMLADAGLNYKNLCIEALNATLDIEHSSAIVTRLVKKVPIRLLKLLRPIIPTLVFRIWK